LALHNLGGKEAAGSANSKLSSRSNEASVFIPGAFQERAARETISRRLGALQQDSRV